MSTHRTSKRYAGQIGVSFMIWMAALAILASSGGITYATLKSYQVKERTEINNLNRSIAECRMNINHYNNLTNEMTNYWAMRDRLHQDGSMLVDIERRHVQTARRLTDTSSRTAMVEQP